MHVTQRILNSKGSETMSNSVESVSARTQSPYSVFGSISKGIVGGAITGYAAKYMLPLNSSEMDEEYKLITNSIRECSKDLKGIPIRAIRNLEKRTPAQDVFLKVVDASQNNQKAGLKSRALEMRKIIQSANLNEEGLKELKNIIAQINEKASKSYLTYIDAFNASVKRVKRPAIGFMAAGSVVGFFAGLAYKVLAGKNS